jgi:DNA-binding transcriptional regulator YiaG
MTGKDINRGLRRFNEWFDVFILTAAKPLSMVGFAMGTVDIFNRGGLAINPFFSFGWSLVQAITIDGLFFAVWYRIFEHGISRWRRFFLGIIGVVLGFVVVVTNGILGFQQLWGVGDSQSAMVRLGIEPALFTLVRAVLVVMVAIMVAYVYRSDNAREIIDETTTDLARPAGKNIDEPNERSGSRPETPVVITETPTEIPQLPEGHSETLTESGILTGERMRREAREAVRTDLSLNIPQFSRETGIPTKTLYRWRSEK